jgi:small conductance mechanosensitive channel
MGNWISLVEEKLSRWGTYLIKMLPNFALALLILFGFIVGARLIQRIVHKLILKVSRSESISSLVSGILYSVVLIFGILAALNVLKLDQAVTSLLAGVGIIGLALGFAFQDLTANFIAGAFIAFKRPFDVGHIVETNGFIGSIEEIELRSTRLRTTAGLHVVIPNREIFQKPIINYSLTDSRKVELEFSVANTLDLAMTESLLKNAIAQESTSARDVEVFFSAIDEPKIKVYISFWTPNNDPVEFMRARHQAILRVYDAFIENNIYVRPEEPAK